MDTAACISGNRELANAHAYEARAVEIECEAREAFTAAKKYTF